MNKFYLEAGDMDKTVIPFWEETYQKAVEVMESCDEVICCLTEFGTMNEKNRLLAQGKSRMEAGK